MAVETPITLARKAAEVLSARGIENARLDAELLLAAVLGVRRLDLYLQHERPVTGEELEAYRAAIRRRLRREPVQYIVGRAAFRDVELRVDSRVLIPRPETEVLVDLVLRWAVTRSGVVAAGDALEVGTGSGAIAVCLARDSGFRRIVATDASAAALDVARQNVARWGVADRVELRHGAGWLAVRGGERFAAIVSNPPYVAETERATLQPEVADYEPALALFGGPDGMGVVRDIVAGAAERLVPGGLLALEMGITQTAAVRQALEGTGAFEAVGVTQDLTARPRFVTAVRTGGRKDD